MMHASCELVGRPHAGRVPVTRASFGRSVRRAILALGLLLLPFPAARAARWEPVDPADLAATASPGFPEADVEILLSRHEMEECQSNHVVMLLDVGKDQLITTNFIRAKIYTAKGVTDLGKFSIRFRSDHQVTGTAARVVKADGSARELTKGDILETVLKRTRGEREQKEITFVFPGLEPGDVVEYQWVEVLGRELFVETFFCQEEFPVREYHFIVGDMASRGSVGWMHCPPAETSNRDNFEVTLRNLAAFKAEDYMPPLYEFRGWIYVAKMFPMAPTEKDIWRDLSIYWGDEFKTATRPNTPVKKAAAELLAGAATDDDKLRRLYEFCQNEIFNTSYRITPELQAAVEKHRDQSADSPAKILEQKRGRSDEINRLFGALARAAGYEARYARNASQSTIANVMIPCGWGFVGSDSVAVQCGGEWRYFNPGNYLLPYGLMAADDEGATTLLCDTKKAVEYGRIPASAASDSQVTRKGRLTLDDEGTLTGEVEIVYSGHIATIRKADTWSDTLAEATKDFCAEINARLPNAEVTEVQWTNLENQQMPVTVRYQVRVPGYAQQVGKRLIFGPGFFESGRNALFTANERQFPIIFPYPWQEHDDVEIVLPEGFALDKPSAPQPVGSFDGAMGATYAMQYNGKTRTFSLRRDFSLGNNGMFAFRAEAYPALKELFELLHQSDTHAIVIKPKAKPASPAAAAPAAAEAAQ